MSPANGALPASEFPRFVSADAVRRADVTETIEATEAERRALAERLELEAIDSLTATVKLRAVRGGQMIRVSGTLEADVVQTCVVTLEPVPAHVSESFEALFAPPSMIEDEGLEIDIDPSLSDEDIPEPMENNRIDIGELTAQHLSLGLDPYPHADGVEFVDHEEDPAEDEVEEEPEKPNPFAVLQKLKPRD
ncbi:YceD family protein [Azospirillum endophyticum]